MNAGTVVQYVVDNMTREKS